MMIFRNFFLLAILLVSLVEARSRNKTTEFFFSPQFIDSKVLNFDNGAKADIDEGFGFGFGFGYNLNPHIELALLFSYAEADYIGSYKDEDGNDVTKKHTLYTSGINFLAAYNFLKGDITPFVSVNGGWTYTDTGIDNGEDYLIWDPIYGYIPFDGTRTDNSFNYGASIGMRFDFKDWFLKASYGKNHINYDDTNDATFDIYQISIGSSL